MDWNDGRGRLLRLYEEHSTVAYYLEGVPLFEQALVEDPNDVTDLFGLAYMHECRARQLLSEAAGLYERALQYAAKDNQANPSYYKLLAHLTRNYIKTGNTHKAIQYVKELILTEPGDPQLYCSLCYCYMLADQPDDAEKTINAALKLDDKNAYVLHFAGEVAKMKERYEQALVYWKQSYNLDNELVDNLYSIAFLLASQNKNAEAIVAWNEIIAWLENRGSEIEIQMPRNEIDKLKVKMEN
jgi:tetratricopeptide (TPR) repeat protein